LERGQDLELESKKN